MFCLVPRTGGETKWNKFVAVKVCGEIKKH